MANDSVANRDSKFFKGGKSKGIKGLTRYITSVTDAEFTETELNRMLFQNGEDGSWGFDPDFVDDAVAVKNRKVELKDEETYSDEPEHTDGDKEETEEQETDTAAASGAFGNMGHSLERQPVISPAPSPSPQREKRSNYTIEKNRPEQNGIKRPSSGGKCREVWDECDHMREAMNGGTPTSEQIRKLSEDKGWNKNNTMIEFYQWRKFNGITGRAQK